MAKRRSYTKEEREAVVADVPALGVTEAARKHGVPQTNVTHWARAAGVGREGKPSPTATRRPKAKARKSKVAARPKRARKGRSAGKTRREQPVAARSEREPKAKTGKSKGAARPKRKKERAGHEPAMAAPSDAKEPSAGRSKSEATAGASAQPPGRRTLKIRVAKIYTPSQKGEILEHAATHGITDASKKFGVSRFSIYGWQRKVNNAAKGEGPSPTAGPGPKDLEAQRDKEILDEWHRHPGLGPSQIRNQLRQVPDHHRRSDAARPLLAAVAIRHPSLSVYDVRLPRVISHPTRQVTVRNSRLIGA